MNYNVRKHFLVSDVSMTKREMITSVSIHVISQHDWNEIYDEVRKQVLVSYFSITKRNECMRKHVLKSYVSMTKDI